MLAGQDPAMFPEVTFREMLIVIEAAMKRDSRQAWLAAQYNAIAYHDPNDMPEDPAVEQKPTSNEADVIYVRAWMRSLAERGNDGC